MRPQELPPLTQYTLRPSTHGITVEWPPAAQLGGPCVVGLCQSGHMNVKYAVIILNTSPACEHAGDLAWLELVHSVYLLCRGWGHVLSHSTVCPSRVTAQEKAPSTPQRLAGVGVSSLM